MKAHARLTACFDGSRTVLRELRSMAPLSLVPRRDTGPEAVVHLVNSATAPLGGDNLRLTIQVGAGAVLHVVAVAATLVLPGPHGTPSTSLVELDVADGGSLEYLPGPVIVTAGANHTAELRGDIAGHLHARETLVLGRDGERPGRLTTTQHLTRGPVPLLRQTLTVGDPELDASIAHLAGHRVMATALMIGEASRAPASGRWWSRTALAAGGTLATSLAPDVVTAQARLEAATSA
ncbi:urease accessory protein UreD [Labedaea rhizosphaerae]|uniref:Urease accessory protein n=1 Tax=Labedaea rhizosphaerae TaxID=598644 RepID=A0A4R6S983_LABRH|nr:urease accessory protein UreD [Labedaea rhizosphaerae]TDP96430.1 urease accessory protein [Labedaea rhizosphaerae]